MSVYFRAVVGDHVVDEDNVKIVTTSLVGLRDTINKDDLLPIHYNTIVDQLIQVETEDGLCGSLAERVAQPIDLLGLSLRTSALLDEQHENLTVDQIKFLVKLSKMLTALAAISHTYTLITTNLMWS